MKFLVESSARHIHLDRAAMDVLFGEGSELTIKKNLSQPGQYACEERVDIVGPKREIKGVSILGPLRNASQVEVSLTDCFTLGIYNAAVRESGDIEGTPGVTLRGPKGELTLEKGLIVAKRHIHCTPADAEQLGVADKEIVKVRIASEGRTTIFDDVVVRVSPKFGLAMHIDTDEANAALVPKNGGEGEIVK